MAGNTSSTIRTSGTDHLATDGDPSADQPFKLITREGRALHVSRTILGFAPEDLGKSLNRDRLHDSTIVDLADSVNPRNLKFVPVAPHFLSLSEQLPQTSERGNTAVRLGEVREVVPPEDPRNLTQKFTEYRVAVQHLDESGSSVTRDYPHCTVMTLFGGLADVSTWTPRADPSYDRATGLGRGSKVLVVCVSGDSSAAVIIGGVRDDRDPGDLGLRDNLGKLHYYARFNGLSAAISEDGSFQILRSGPTDVLGKTTAEKAGILLMQADGKVVLGSGARGETVSSNRVEISDDLVKVSSGRGFRVGEADQAFILGTSYRDAEQDLHQRLLELVIEAMVQIEGCATAFKSIAVLHVLPILGPILAAPAMGQIGIQMTALTLVMQGIRDALQEFEDGESGYLSTRNFGD